MRTNKNYHRILILGLILLLSSCSRNLVNYKSLNKWQKKGYTIRLNGKAVDAQFQFLDRSNVSAASVNHREKQMLILQKDPNAKFLPIDTAGFANDSIGIFKPDLMVIDGVSFEKGQFHLLQIELSVVGDVILIKEENPISFCRSPSNLLLITTKTK